MKLKDLHETKYNKSGSVLQRYEDAYNPINNESTEITPGVLFQSFEIEYPTRRLAGIFTFQVSVRTTAEICMQVKCPSCSSQVGNPCYFLRGKIHKDRYKKVNEILNNEDIFINQDVQYAYGFVKHLLRKYNLPYTEIRIGIAFTKWITFAVFSSELKGLVKTFSSELKEIRGFSQDL